MLAKLTRVSPGTALLSALARSIRQLCSQPGLVFYCEHLLYVFIVHHTIWEMGTMRLVLSGRLVKILRKSDGCADETQGSLTASSPRRRQNHPAQAAQRSFARTVIGVDSEACGLASTLMHFRIQGSLDIQRISKFFLACNLA